MSHLHILEINLLSAASFANIYSHSESCFFVLLKVSFAMQKLLSLKRESSLLRRLERGHEIGL